METIVELRAGCMVLADGRLAPDPRKGLIRITQARWEAGSAPPAVMNASGGRPAETRQPPLTARLPFPPPLSLQDEAGLTHFCWLERDASGAAVGEPEQDIVVIPGESTFGKVGAGPAAAAAWLASPAAPPAPLQSTFWPAPQRSCCLHHRTTRRYSSSSGRPRLPTAPFLAPPTPDKAPAAARQPPAMPPGTP